MSNSSKSMTIKYLERVAKLNGWELAVPAEGDIRGFVVGTGQYVQARTLGVKHFISRPKAKPSLKVVT